MNIRHKIDKFLFDRLLPRGGQYSPEPSVQPLYTSAKTENRKLEVLLSQTSHEACAQKMVILAHPYLAKAKLFFHYSGHIPLYKSLGYDVVLFDFNGFGESPFCDFDFEKDILDMVEWVTKHFKPNELILHGISFGAAQIIKSGSLTKKYPMICILENCLDKGIHYFQKRNKLIFNFLKLIHFLSPTLKQKDDFTFGIQNCTDFKKSAFIYGKEDDLTTTTMGKILSKHCPVPYEFVEVNGKHLEGIQQVPEYETFLKKFLQR